MRSLLLAGPNQAKSAERVIKPGRGGGKQLMNATKLTVISFGEKHMRDLGLCVPSRSSYETTHLSHAAQPCSIGVTTGAT